jgi:hypothetical protein
MKLGLTERIVSFSMIKALNIAQDMALNVLFWKEFLFVKNRTCKNHIDLPSQFIQMADEWQTEPKDSTIAVGCLLSKSF